MKLKNTLLIAGIILLSFSLFSASEPVKQTVYSVVKQRQSPTWYKEQGALWKEEIDIEPKNAEAWLNYYTTQRMLKLLRKGVLQEDLNGIVKEMKKAIPDAFEYHYVTYWNGGEKTHDEYVNHLMKAYELGPNRVELFDDLFTHYLLNGDNENKNEVAKQWFSSNDISSGLYAWSYNMLQSIEPNGIVFTVGDNDTYPALVLQSAKGIRTDVVVMNVSLLGVKGYCDKLLTKAGLPEFSKSAQDFPSRMEFNNAIVEHIKNNSKRPVYFAVTAQPYLYASFKNEIYNVGLAFKWSQSKFDNVAVIKRNFEKKYLLDYLEIDLMNDISRGVVDQANANYLMSMLTLFNHYNESEDVNSKAIESLIDRIAKRNRMEEQVEKVLCRKENTSVSLVINDPRKIESDYVSINDKLYAGITEVSNQQYELFLTDLLKQKRFDDLTKAKSEQVDWKGLKEEFNDYSNEVLFPNGHPDNANAPIQNISYEAALLYCKWLTNVYNNTPHKKKAYNDVVFRLPTESEWELVARGGLKTDAYPWNGAFCRNSKGCFLGNWDVSEVSKKENSSTDCESCGRPDQDGGFFTVPVKSYMPNPFGLYNLSGNVAEMIAEKGKTKGGSWNTKAGVALIIHSETFEGTSPEVGFRVIMEIK